MRGNAFLNRYIAPEGFEPANCDGEFSGYLNGQARLTRVFAPEYAIPGDQVNQVFLERLLEMGEGLELVPDAA